MFHHTAQIYEHSVKLRRLGYTSDSMNDVIMVILNKVLQTGDSWKEPQSAKTQVPDGGESPG